jgi:tRNA pseudouridine65 synthase
MHFGVHRLLLHAWRLELAHPVSGAALVLSAPLDAVWNDVLARFGWMQAVADAVPADC